MKKKLPAIKTKIYAAIVYSTMFVAAILLTASGLRGQNMPATGDTGTESYSGDGSAAAAATVKASIYFIPATTSHERYASRIMPQ